MEIVIVGGGLVGALLRFYLGGAATPCMLWSGDRTCAGMVLLAGARSILP